MCEPSPLVLALARTITEQLEMLYPRLAVEVRPARGGSSRKGGKRVPGCPFHVLKAGSVDAVLAAVEDVPVCLAPGLEVAAVCERLAPYQALVSHRGSLLDDIPARGRVGVVDELCRFQLLNHRPDLNITMLHETLDASVKRVRAGRLDGLIAPVAYLELQGWQNAVNEVLDSARFLPPVGRGAFALVCTTESKAREKWLAGLDDPSTHSAVDAERALLGEMNGLDGLLGALAEVSGRVLNLEAGVWSSDGKEVVRDSLGGDMDSATNVGKDLAEKLREDGAGSLFRRGRKSGRSVQESSSSSTTGE
ncbi:MAG: hydroxymethylbilane synthase [Candidatus Eisenbacteria sp.]|nr:hydroxymethylbilane synthase [Candidatus Eisenbacteria bacterium]